jgi:hypothetical protein
MNRIQEEIASVAARYIVEDGLEFGPAKHQALKTLGVSSKVPLPSNEVLEEAVFEHLSLYAEASQAQELQALRALALTWMRRLEVFRPHLTGAVWKGFATSKSDIYLQLFCDDSKSAEIELINQGLDYQVSAVKGFRGEIVDALSLNIKHPELGVFVGLHLMVYDLDDLRGALKPNAKGRIQRGDAKALQKLLDASIPDEGLS